MAKHKILYNDYFNVYEWCNSTFLKFNKWSITKQYMNHNNEITMGNNIEYRADFNKFFYTNT